MATTPQIKVGCSHPGCTLPTGHSGPHIGFLGRACTCSTEA